MGKAAVNKAATKGLPVKEKVAEVEVMSIPEGMQAKDLSVEKRVQLFSADFEKFKAEMSQTYGLTIGVELAGYPNALFPRMTLIDLLKKNEQAKQPEGLKQG